jgi:hypothetical protein
LQITHSSKRNQPAKEIAMLRKIQFSIMLLPVLVATCLSFSVEPVSAIPVDQVIAFDISLGDPEPTTEEVATQVEEASQAAG